MIPALTALRAYYPPENFSFLSIHMPDLGFEAKGNRIQDTIDEYVITYPVGNDAERVLARGFNVTTPPAYFLISPDLEIRWSSTSSVDLLLVKDQIDELLKESGVFSFDEALEPLKVSPMSAIKTLSWKLGVRNLANIGNVEKNSRKPRLTYKYPDTINSNEIFLNGRWSFEEQSILSGASKDSLKFSAVCPGLQIAAASQSSQPIRIFISADGVPINKNNAGIHAQEKDGEYFVDITNIAKVYELIKFAENIQSREIEIRVSQPRLEIWRISCGPFDYLPKPERDEDIPQVEIKSELVG